MPFLILLAALASAPAHPEAAPQDPVQMSRIASDQRLVAEQVRRLTRLLGQLEARDRAEDRAERADLLANAAQRLAGISSGKDLAAAMEAIAGDLAALRTGSAVDGQTSTLETLEEILQLLLQSQAQMQEEQRAADLQERLAELEQLRSRQEELRKRAEDLLQQAREAESGAESSAAEAGEQAAEPGAKDAEPSAEERARGEELAKLAREQAALAEQIAALRKAGRQEAAERASEHAAQAAERLERAAGPQEQETPPEGDASSEQAPPKDGATPPSEAGPPGQSGEKPPSEGAGKPGETGKPQPSSQAQEPQKPQEPQAQGEQAAPPADPQDAERQQERAIEEQKSAEQALREAIEQAKEELERIKKRQQLQDLEDVAILAEQILAQHRLEEAALQELLAAGAANLTRAQRARLRQVARSEEDLASATQSLLIKIETLGASTFPFFLGTIQKDHERLAREVGPPRLQLEEHAAILAADITGNWEMLLDVIRTEAERLSNEMEQKPQDGQPQEPEEQEQPLVDFAQELQLLKRLQAGLARDLTWLRRKFDTYGAAGIASGPDEEHALSVLLDRQLELRRQFEDMLSRLQAQKEASLPAKDL